LKIRAPGFAATKIIIARIVQEILDGQIAQQLL
jgi:hypothetical protein